MKTRKNSLISEAIAFAALVFFIISGCTDAQDELIGTNSSGVNLRVASEASSHIPQYVPNEILVKFNSGVTSSIRNNVLSRINGIAAEKILTHAMKYFGDDEGITLVKTPMAVMDAISKMKGAEGIKYAEPNYIYTTDATSDDPYFTNGSLWGMYGSSTTPSNQYGCHAAAAWAKGNTGSKDVWIGIIDEGYMYMHEDLAANVGTNPGEIAGDGVDNDGNGYVDDVYGWDFDKNDNTVFDGTGDDHGTHVAGTIGAVGGNKKGVAGVCWNIKLMNAKFLGKRGGTTANAIKAVDYFTNLKTNRHLNIVATNNSWGGGGYSQGLSEAIERANTANILFIVAAGNDGSDIDNKASYPAAYDNENIIAVAAINKTGGLSGFSNYGATSVDLGAPGEGVWSCIPKSSKRVVISSYASYSGTSMATPHVTGAVALYAASRQGVGAIAIKSAILSSVISTPSLSGKCLTGGRLNVSGF